MQIYDNDEPKKKTFSDNFSLAISTFGVGFIPLAPGTWGSAVGVGIFLLAQWAELNFFLKDLLNEKLSVAVFSINLLLLIAFCLLGIWAAGRTAVILQKKDPQKVVVDEVMGQLIVFLFVPLVISWKLILAGFLLFRLFDIWKPYPIKEFENLSGGLGICADDIVAGIYGGICLSLIYAVSFYF